jgi:predicted CXXCH cytochrome family protein
MVYNAGMSLYAKAAVLVALPVALGFARPSWSADVAPAPRAIEFVMPAAGAFIPSGMVIAAGRIPVDAGFVNLLLDDLPVTGITREGLTFSAQLTPGPGAHTLEARAGNLRARLAFTFGSGGRGAAPYRYHQPVLEDRCADCHAAIRRQSPTAEAETCKGCHRKLAVFYPYVHGPLAAGKCLVCHDPHGSDRPSLTVADAKTMCTRCHDQPESLDHAQTARSRVCYLCHNPHTSMNRKFLYDIVK